MSLEQTLSGDFDRARRKHLWRQVASWLTGRSNALLPFEETRRQVRARIQREGGLHEVPIDAIVGSVGRYRDFDSAFLPNQARTRGRWINIDRAHHTDVILPPVELYKLDSLYFVKDGNHRVSVARERGQEFIDAYVTELHSPTPIRSVDELEQWQRRQDALDFFEKTNLLQLRPGADIDLTLPGQYEKLIDHIAVHGWFMGEHEGRPISEAEAVASWFDHVYQPLVETIRESGVLSDFPHRTEADLYLWIIEHLWYLREAGQISDDADLHDVVRSYAREYSERATRRLARAVRRTRRGDGPAAPRLNASP